MTFRIQVAGKDQFGGLAADLRRAGKGIRPKLTAELRSATKPIYDEARNAILKAQLPARRTGATPTFTATIASRGLRKPTAAALEWKVTTSAAGPEASVAFRPSKVPARISALVPYWLGQKRRLRHPVMGRRSRWVSQTIPNVWARPSKQMTPAAQKAAAKAIDDTAAIIAGKA